MNAPVVTCPFCRAQTRGGKFCGACGAILPYSVRAAGADIPPTRVDDPIVPPTRIQPTPAAALAPRPPEGAAAGVPGGGAQAVLSKEALAAGGPLADATPAVALPKDPFIAVALELVPGLLLQTFGIGNLYVGNVAVGLLLMFGYWMAAVVNFTLCFVSGTLGGTTWTLTFLAAAALGSMLAYGKAKQTQSLVARRLD